VVVSGAALGAQLVGTSGATAYEEGIGNTINKSNIPNTANVDKL